MSGPVLFGKLPDRADFVRRGGRSPALDALDELSQDALRDGTPTREGPLYRMVFVPPSGPQALIGALQLSRDRVGRTYPLVAGRPTSRPRLDPDAAAAWPLRWAPVLGAAAGLIDDAITNEASIAAVDARLDALPSLAPLEGRALQIDAHVRALSALPGPTLWSRIWGEEGASRIGLVLSRLLHTPPGPLPYGVQFPLPAPSPDFGRSDAVAFWLAACWHLLPTPPSPPSLFWTDGDPGALVVFVSSLRPAAFRPLLFGASARDQIAAVDAGSPATVERATSALPESFRRLLTAPTVTVADLLGQLHTLR